MALTDKLSSIADAIRGKTGKAEEMTLDQMATEIAGIETGGGGGIVLLHRAEVTEPVSLIQVDPTEDWKNYNLIVIVPRMLTPNTSEWLCCKTLVGLNTYNEYIGTTGSISLPMYDIQHSFHVLSLNNGKAYYRAGGSMKEYDVSELKQFKFHPYYAQNTFVSGAIEIYGVML